MPPASNRTGQPGRPLPCHHVAALHPVQPYSVGCQECLDQGTDWVGLWLCLSCGWVACSNDSPQQHAKAHYEETDHPVVSLQQIPDARWCHAHQRSV